MSGALLTFGAAFLAVFTLGLQSLNVNQGHYVAAGTTSFFISSGHLLLYQILPTSPVWSPQVLGYYIGGMLGITSSIWFHKNVRAWWSALRERRERARRRPGRRCTRCAIPESSVAQCQRADCPGNDDVH